VIRSLILLNCGPCRGFVQKSPVISSVRHQSSDTFPAEILSVTKKKCVFMCWSSLLNVYHSSTKKNTQNIENQATRQYSMNNVISNGDMGIKITRKIPMTQLSAKTGPTDARTRYSECLQKRINQEHSR
jgi:hypothetical protein